MQVEVLEKYAVPQVPSVSGMEIIDGQVWLMGDDTSYLYRLDGNYQVCETVSLYRDRRKPGEKTPKLLKADLEGMASFVWRGTPYIMVVGSGSLPVVRERGYLLTLNEERQHFRLDLAPLYSFLKEEYHIADLNIEGITTTEDHIFFVQRGNLAGDNYLFQFPIDELIPYVLGHHTNLPKATARLFDLGATGTVPRGFGGLQTLNNTQLLAVVAVENTKSTYLDGQTLGSYLAIIDLTLSTSTIEVVPLEMNGQALLEKAESLAILERVSDRELIVLIASDNDDLPSSLIKARVQF